MDGNDVPFNMKGDDPLARYVAPLSTVYVVTSDIVPSNTSKDHKPYFDPYTSGMGGDMINRDWLSMAAADLPVETQHHSPVPRHNQLQAEAPRDSEGKTSPQPIQDQQSKADTRDGSRSEAPKKPNTAFPSTPSSHATAAASHEGAAAYIRPSRQTQGRVSGLCETEQVDLEPDTVWHHRGGRKWARGVPPQGMRTTKTNMRIPKGLSAILKALSPTVITSERDQYDTTTANRINQEMIDILEAAMERLQQGQAEQAEQDEQAESSKVDDDVAMEVRDDGNESKTASSGTW